MEPDSKPNRPTVKHKFTVVEPATLNRRGVNMFTKTERNLQNLSSYARGIRVVLAAVMILITMTTPVAPLGLLALLPLLAIYPAYIAITGWSPVKALYQHQPYLNAVNPLSVLTRAALLILGASLIGSATWVPGSLGAWAVLPLLAIIPVYVAIIGRDPVATLISNADEQGAPAARFDILEQPAHGFPGEPHLDIAA